AAAALPAGRSGLGCEPGIREPGILVAASRFSGHSGLLLVKQQLEDGPGELREVDTKRCVGGALSEQHHHYQTWHNEGTIGYTVCLAHTCSDCRAEHDKV